MTESPFPFGAVEEPAAFEVVDEPAADSRRNLIALGGLAAVVLLGGAYFLLGGDDELVDDVAFTPRARPAVAPSASPQAVKVPVATKIDVGRNPFKALYVQPAAAAAAPTTVTPVTTTPVTTTPVTTTPVGTTPIVIVTPTEGSTTAPAPQPTSGGTTAPAPPSTPTRTQSTLSLEGVTTKSGTTVGTFVYDGKTVTGSAGDVMDGKLQLISLQQDATGSWFANLKLGDGSPFEIHENQTVVVQ
ncbi:MAG: hypothetical protein JWN08_3093 [Frankiales bacterium]|nr:hypothetical protein [Frankiales bacterium]